MKICPQCSAENPDAARFCNNCGIAFTSDTPINFNTPKITAESEKKRKTGNIIVLIIGIICFCYFIGFLINKIPNNRVFMTSTSVALKISSLTPTSTKTPEPIISGGIGLSKIDWENKHTRTYMKDFTPPDGMNYDKVYDVIFKNLHVYSITRYLLGIPIDDPLIEQEIKNLTPPDKEFIISSIVEDPEIGKMKMDIYFSKILKDQIENNMLTLDFAPWADFGYFAVMTIFNNQKIAGIMISPGIDESEIVYPTAIAAPEITNTKEISRKMIISKTTEQPTSACPKGCTRPPVDCTIKGNVSFRTGEKIYHLPDDAYYSKTDVDPSKGELWFCTEEEAISNGWRRAEY